VVVKYFADIRKLTGCEAEPWHAAAPSLRDLVEQLGERHGAPLHDRVVERGQLSSTIIVLVNGQNIEHLRGLDTPLGADDVVAIFPMVAGG
jgi:molybdopterin synthase sulfur carrier subunit